MAKFEKTNIARNPEKVPTTSIGGYFLIMGSDSQDYGPGTIGMMQGKNFLVKFSYTDWQKLDMWINQNKDFFNSQLDKETAIVQSITRR